MGPGRGVARACVSLRSMLRDAVRSEGTEREGGSAMAWVRRGRRICDVGEMAARCHRECHRDGGEIALLVMAEGEGAGGGE